MLDPAQQVLRRLHAAGDPVRAAAEKRYLKSPREHLGVSVPATRAIVRELAVPDGELLDVVADLWRRPVHDARLAAVLLLEREADGLAPADLAVVEAMLREAGTWALVDPLAVKVAGGLVERQPQLAGELDRWAGDPDFWIRRSALLALLRPLRRGDGDFARFGRYADAMLDEREFFVRKAIGWVLRDTARRRPQLVFDWICPRAARASGVTLREAVKYLSPQQRRAIDVSRGAAPPRPSTPP